LSQPDSSIMDIAIELIRYRIEICKVFMDRKILSVL
jgi:hypothetical protein